MPRPFPDLRSLLLALLATFVLLASPVVALADDSDLPILPISQWKVFLVETDDYEDDAISPLPGAKNDVDAIRKRLEELGVPSGSIEEYSSQQKVKHQPSKEKIEEGFQKYLDNLTENDFAFVYLIGHGMENKDTKTCYYMPNDADPDDFGKSIALNRENGWLKRLGESKARLILVVVDACRVDPTRGVNDFTMSDEIEPPPKSVTLLLSCGPNQRSYEMKTKEKGKEEEEEHGVFTSKFLEALVLNNNPADENKDGTLSIYELTKYVIDKTFAEVKKSYDREQRPYTQGQQTAHGVLTNLKSDEIDIDARYDELKAEAMKAFKREDFDEALSKCDEMLELKPEKEEEILEQRKVIEDTKIAKEIEEIIKKADSHREKKDYDKALRVIKDALDLYPDNPQLKEKKAQIENEIVNPIVTTNPTPVDPTSKFALSDDKLLPGDREKLTIRETDFVFHYCPPGTFTMGSPIDEKWRMEAETEHAVTLTKGFWLLEAEVTQKQWKAIMGDNPSHFTGDVLRPVEMISWNDCDEFVQKLNGLNVAPQGWRFALPTEAQWEYACRAGTKTPFFWGDKLNGDKANCNGELPYSPDGLTPEGQSLGKTSRVKEYSPNRWGFYDMHGNVWEWCRIWYGAYHAEPITNPIGPKTGMGRVVRGGSWRDPASFCRSAYRQWNDPGERHDFVGVRIALVSNSAKKSKDDEDNSTGQNPNPQTYEPSYDSDPDPSLEPVGTGLLAAFDGEHTPGEQGFIELNGVKFAFRYCRQGAEDFWIMESPITQRQWEAIVGDNPSQIQNASRPVNMISWGDCVNVANSLNLALGENSGWIFALPSEAQWDFARDNRRRLGTKYEEGNLCFLEWRADYGSKVYINDKIKSGTQGVTVNPPLSSVPLKQGLETRRMDLGARFALIRSPN